MGWRAPGLVWSDGEHLRLAEVPEHATSLLGRTPGAALDLSDEAKYDQYKTVSRQHALVRGAAGGQFVLEHLSVTNTTQVNGVVVTNSAPLSDGDTIHLGTVQLAFHDLAAADRFSGPHCPHCGRENTFTDHECWYCGTSLVNRSSTEQNMVCVVFRVVAADGARYDVYPDDVFRLQRSGTPEVHRSATPPTDGALVIEPREDRAVLHVSLAEEGVTVNGRPPTGAAPLYTGDEIRAAGRQFVMLVRR